MSRNILKKAIILGIAGLLFTAALLPDIDRGLEIALFAVSYLLAGTSVVLKAAGNIFKGRVFDESFLMSIATIGAFAVSEFAEGVAVMLFYRIGALLESIAVDRSRKAIASLMDIRPDYANVKIGEEISRVNPEQVLIGQTIIVKPGERIPLDGRVLEGRSSLDTSALTGESLPRYVEAGSDVLAGFVNMNGLLAVEVLKSFKESTVTKILELVQQASGRKAPTEKFITKFARYYTPAVVLIAAGIAVIPPVFIPGEAFADWFYRGLVFLVISCPCALVVSIPLGFFGGIGGASRSGILIKGGNYLEALNKAQIVVLDKTGTLTKGDFKVTQLNPANGLKKEKLLEYAAFAESYSNHPIAISVLKAYGKSTDTSSIKEYDEIFGLGTKIIIKDGEVLAGNGRLMERYGVEFAPTESDGTMVHVAVNRRYAGHLVIADEIRENSDIAIKRLKAMGIKKIVMLSGDVRAIAEKVASKLGIEEVYAELLPHQKVEKLEMLNKQKSRGGKLIFVGDGINDAPVLAMADVGMAMGGLGSDAAIEAADVVLMTDDPAKIADAIAIARRTKRIIWQNIIFALSTKSVVMVLGAAGLVTMWGAVFADVGAVVIAVLNSMRAMKAKKSI